MIKPYLVPHSPDGRVIHLVIDNGPRFDALAQITRQRDYMDTFPCDTEPPEPPEAA